MRYRRNIKLSDWSLVHKATKKAYALCYGSTTIGREGAIKISDKKVSRLHAEIIVTGSTITLKDSSIHGTWVEENCEYYKIQNGRLRRRMLY